MKLNRKFVRLIVGAFFTVLLVMGLTINPGWANFGGAATDSVGATHVNQHPHSLNYVQNYAVLNPVQKRAAAMEELTIAEGELIPECRPGEVYYLPNPYNCETFYQCANGVPVLMPCPAGTEWDDLIQTCNWPDQAQCIEVCQEGTEWDDTLDACVEIT